MPRKKDQKAVPTNDFIRLYQEAGKHYDTIRSNGKKHKENKVEAYKKFFVRTFALSESAIDKRATGLCELGEINDLWHKREWQPSATDLVSKVPAGSPLVTYHHDPSAQAGVYYTILLKEPHDKVGIVVYAGKAEDAFGYRLLSNTKFKAYEQRVPHNESLIVETRCLVSFGNDNNVLLNEYWITRCWSVLTCRLPSLHQIDKRTGKSLALHGLRRLKLSTLRKALKHLIEVGNAHEAKRWLDSGRGDLKLEERLCILLKSLLVIKCSLKKKQRIPRVTGGPSGKGKGVNVVRKTKMEAEFTNSDPENQWLEKLRFSSGKKSKHAGLADTEAGKKILDLLQRPDRTGGSSETAPPPAPFNETSLP